MLMTYPWLSQREWNNNNTLIEKEAIGEQIDKLGFNQYRGGKQKFLVAIAGDTHLLAYDTGFHNQDYGSFPIFQCSPLDSPPSCKQGGYTDDIYMNRGQFCHFTVSKHQDDPSRSCLQFVGYSAGKSVMTYNLCNPVRLERQIQQRDYWLEQKQSADPETQQDEIGL